MCRSTSPRSTTTSTTSAILCPVSAMPAFGSSARDSPSSVAQRATGHGPRTMWISTMGLQTIFILCSAFVLALTITALLVPPVQRLCERRGWLAQPGGRRNHARPTPNVGGIAIYLGFVLTLLGTFALGALDPALQR